MKLADALQAATFVSVYQNDHYFRVDAATPDEMVDGCEDPCFYVHDEDSGEDYEYTWDEVVELYSEGDLNVFKFQEIAIDG